MAAAVVQAVVADWEIWVPVFLSAVCWAVAGVLAVVVLVVVIAAAVALVVLAAAILAAVAPAAVGSKKPLIFRLQRYEQPVRVGYLFKI